jgi:hypothetical protein
VNTEQSCQTTAGLEKRLHCVKQLIHWQPPGRKEERGWRDLKVGDEATVRKGGQKVQETAQMVTLIPLAVVSISSWIDSLQLIAVPLII